MRLKDIDILNFKNIPATRLEFSPGVNCLLGMNGMGKSNLLEAIHFLGMTRPMGSLPDSALVRHGEDMMMVKGTFLTDGGEEDIISLGVVPGQAKRLKRNGKEYRRLSEHIGRYPMVSVTPNDSKIASGSAEERRKLMDMVISQGDAVYLDALIRYGRSRENRNRMLRAGVKDTLLYESIEANMAESAATIHTSRLNWIERIAKRAEEIYARLAGSPERLTLSLKSHLNDKTLGDLLDERRAKDQVLGYTSAGPHRDDMSAFLDDYPIREIGSQGQLKTFTIALKLAVFEYLKEIKGTLPLLLLDDIFDKLDASRVENIMREVSGEGNFGQIFITDTNRKHLDDILRGLNGDKSLISVENGTFIPVATV